MKVDGALRSLIQGVSQQPRRTRYPGQCTLQENMSSNPVEGLSRRPPTEYLAELFSTANDVQFYDYEIAGVRYFVAFTAGGIQVFDIEGTEYTVNEASDGYDYLDGNTLTATTLEDVTYVSNLNTVVDMETDTASYVTGESIVYILGANYGRTYTITINYNDTVSDEVITVSHTAPDGSSSAHTAQIATDYIANALETLLDADGDFVADGFAVERQDDHLYITNSNSYEFTVQVSDGDHGVNMYGINNRAPSIARVPRYAPHGYILTIQSGNNNDATNLYLAFVVIPNEGETVTQGTGFGRNGQWYEVVAPGIEYLMDVTTMPHILTFDSGTEEFTFGPGAWKGRQVGDLESNEDPSFVGKTIQDISYFQGRLVFISGLATIMSRTRDPYDFFNKTATALLDDDPIDIESTAKDVAKLERLVPFNRDLVIFANRGQFIVFGRTALTPKNASMILTTTFEAELNVPPVVAGRNIFFAINRGRYTGIREFYSEGSQDINDARPTTDHIIKYMPGTITHMSNSTNMNILLVQTDADPTKVFVYEYLWADDQKAQSSWSTWIMPFAVVDMFFIESILYLVMKDSEDYILAQLDLDTQTDTGLTYQVHLDNKVSVTSVNTTVTNPWWTDLDENEVIIIQGEGCPYPGMRVGFTYSSPTFTLDTDMEGGTVILGTKYLSRYKPTMPLVKDQDGVKIGTGKLTIGHFLVNYRESGGMMAKVTSDHYDDVMVEFTGRIVGNAGSTIGNPVIQSGTYLVPFRDNADLAELELYTEAETPLNIMDIEWEGQFNKRGKRIPQGG